MGRLIRVSVISGKAVSEDAGLVARKFALRDFALAAFQIIQADGTVQIGHLTVVTALTAGEKLVQKTHGLTPIYRLPAANMLRRSNSTKGGKRDRALRPAHS